MLKNMFTLCDYSQPVFGVKFRVFHNGYPVWVRDQDFPNTNSFELAMIRAIVLYTHENDAKPFRVS